MNEYFICIFNAAVTLTTDNFEVDLVTRAMDNMDPTVKIHYESNYTSYLSVRARDKVSQISALQAFQSPAEQSESQTIGILKMLTDITSTVLRSVPWYSWIGHGLRFLIKKSGVIYNFFFQKVEKRARTAKNDVFGNFSENSIVFR